MQASEARNWIAWQSEYPGMLGRRFGHPKPERLAGSLANPLEGFANAGLLQSFREVVLLALGYAARENEDIIFAEGIGNE